MQGVDKHTLCTGFNQSILSCMGIIVRHTIHPNASGFSRLLVRLQHDSNRTGIME